MATRVVKAGDTLSKIALQEGVNVSDISGFRSGNPDLIFPNEVLTINKPIDRNTVVTGGTNVGTVPSPRPDLTGFDRSLQDKALDDLIRDAFRGSQKKVDENKIRQDNLRFFQSEIDAVNQIYDEVLRGERIEGRDREGQGRAIRNRQGLIGSARGEKQREDIVEQNLSIERGIQAERAAKIGSIMGTARQSSIAEIRAETDAKRQSASDYLQFLTLQDDRTDKRVKQAVTALMLQGFKFEDLEGNEIDELTKNLRISKDALAAKFSELTPEAEGNQILSEGQVIVDKDGNIVFKNPRTFAPKAGSKTTPTPTSTTETPEGTVISFEEFRSSERGREELDRLQEAAKQTFTTARADEVLRNRYEEIKDELRVSVAPALTNQTPSTKQSLEKAGLTNTGGDVQRFYLATPSKFRDFYIRQSALGEVPQNVDLDTLADIYSEWRAEEEGDTTTDEDSAFGF